MHIFEVFIRGNQVEAKDWQGLTRRLANLGKKLEFEMVFRGRKVEFLVRTEEVISIREEGPFILEPKESEIEEEVAVRAVWYGIPAGLTVAEAKKREEQNKGRTITKVRAIWGRIWRVKVYMKDERGREQVGTCLTLVNPLWQWRIEFGEGGEWEKKAIPVRPELAGAEELLDKLGGKSGGVLTVGRKYLKLDGFDAEKHTLVVGQTGVGKTKLLELLVRLLAGRGYGVIVVDPHAAMNLNGGDRQVTLDFVKNGCDLFPGGSDPYMTTEMTVLLFKTLIGEQYNAKLERVLKYAVYSLLMAKAMTLPNLRRFLSEMEFRGGVLAKIGDNDQLRHFFETEFGELETKFYETAVMPILALVDELVFTPVFSHKGEMWDLRQLLQEKSIINLSLNRVALGDRATRMIAGLVIQQVFLLAMAGVGKKLVLVVDEVATVENEGLAGILAQARKFGLAVYLSGQYLDQMSPRLLAAILANIYNYFVFKVSDEDGKILGKNMEMIFGEGVLSEAKRKGVGGEELKREVLARLDPRQCVARLFKDGKFYSSFVGRTVDI